MSLLRSPFCPVSIDIDGAFGAYGATLKGGPNMSKAENDPNTETREPSAWRLEQAISAFQQFREALASDEDLADDEEAIIAALAGAAYDDPRALLSRLIDAAVWAERREDEAKLLEYGYRDRRRRYEHRKERLRLIVEQVMQAIETTRATGKLASATIGNAPPSLVVTDEKAIPAEWWKIERSLRVADLKQHIRETGELVPGALLSNGGSMLVLRKVR